MSDLSLMQLTVAEALTIYPFSEGKLITGRGRGTYFEIYYYDGLPGYRRLD